MAEAWTYISPGSSQIVLTEASANRYLHSVEGVGMPKSQHFTTNAAQQHGVTFQNFRLNSRVVTMSFGVLNTDRQAMYDTNQTFIERMRQDPSTGILRFQDTNDVKYELDVHFYDGLDTGVPSRINPFSTLYTLQFIAYDPVWRQLPQASHTSTIPTTSQLQFPITYPIQYYETTIEDTDTIVASGTWQSNPIVTITGPILNPTVTNSTTDEKLEFSYTVSASEVVTIDLTPGTKTITNASSTNLISKLSADSDLGTFHLAVDPEAAGGSNTILMEGADATIDTSIAMSWYNRYIGI